MISTTTTPVQENTNERVNERIHEQAKRNAAYF
jgi:hypothetical protein